MEILFLQAKSLFLSCAIFSSRALKQRPRHRFINFKRLCKFTSREPHFIVSKLETLSFVLLANESGSIKDKQYENIKNFYNIKLKQYVS